MPDPIVASAVVRHHPDDAGGSLFLYRYGDITTYQAIDEDAVTNNREAENQND